MKRKTYRNNTLPFVSPPGIPSPVERITGMWEFSFSSHHHGVCHSTPSHLIHLVTRGRYRLRTDGREYEIHAGDVIWYYESENVEWLSNDTPVTFYSVGFDAPWLPPPPLEARVFPGSRTLRRAFEALFDASLLAQPVSRNLGMHTALLQMLAEVHRCQARAGSPAVNVSTSNTPAQLWWGVEKNVRTTRCFRPTLEELSDWAGCSRASLCRACHAATGVSPIRRLRDLRMAEAKGLLLLSTMNVSQIAEYLGYLRVHEFSREYRKYFHHAPTATRIS